MQRASIEWLDEDWFAISTPYHPKFVDDLKDGTRTRRWNPEAKHWECQRSDYERALRVLLRHFDVVDTPAFRPGQSPYDFLGVKEDAPMEVIEAAYKAMMKLHHPDLHGSGATARMAKINAAMDAIRGLRA